MASELMMAALFPSRSATVAIGSFVLRATGASGALRHLWAQDVLDGRCCAVYDVPTLWVKVHDHRVD